LEWKTLDNIYIIESRRSVCHTHKKQELSPYNASYFCLDLLKVFCHFDFVVVSKILRWDIKIYKFTAENYFFFPQIMFVLIHIRF
jgi:hypothetical protein